MLLYIHIPFCDSKCHYCSFNSYVDKFDFRDSYAKAIIKQLKYELQRYSVHKQSIETIFIGGGTPSAMQASLYQELFENIKPYIAKNAEITTEANPNSASKSWLEQMKELGVNRVSFGVQSFDKDKLKYLGRNHSKEDAKNAIKNAYNAGIKNISLDLIHGCILDNKKLLQNDLDIAFSLPINHISSYSLSIEKNTKFYIKKEKNNGNIKEEQWFYDQIIKKGFSQYEISNFGKYRSIHNLGYWKYKDYIGIGAGAVGFLQNKRFYPYKNIEKYIKNPTFFDIENLSGKDIKTEKVFLGMRSIVGVNIDIFNKNELKKVKILEKEGKIRHINNIIFNNNYLLSDEISLFILS